MTSWKITELAAGVPSELLNVALLASQYAQEHCKFTAVYLVHSGSECCWGLD
jgi:hypothetical protein